MASRELQDRQRVKMDATGIADAQNVGKSEVTRDYIKKH